MLLSPVRLKTVVGALLLLAAALPAEDAGADRNFAAADQARDLLAEGVKEYRSGRPAAAALAFQRALALQPDNKLLFQFYQAAGDGLLVQMERYDELEPVLKDVLRRARIYQKELRHSPEFIETLIAKLDGGSEEERVVATQELIAIGPVAVPQLIARFGDNRQDERRTYLRVVLTRMGYRAVIPLGEALKAADQRLVASVATILADIADPRSLPHLQRVSAAAGTDDTTRGVCGVAIEAIARRAGMSTIPDLDATTLAEAQRYLAGGDLVRDEQVANESLAWRWDADNGKLTFVAVPRYAWNEVVAEQLLFDGLATNPGYAAYQPVLAAVLGAHIAEPSIRARLAKERTTPVQHADEGADAIAERLAALGEQHLRLRLCGSDALLRGVQEALVAQRTEVAVILMRELQDRALAQPERSLPTGEQADPAAAASVLVSALDHPDKTVRYQAATTLAHLDPARAFPGAAKVGRILADAVGEWGARVVLVIDQDYRGRNAARAALQAKGYIVATAVDGFEAMQRLEEAPAKDAILLAGDLAATIKDEHGALVDVPEQQAATLIEQLRKDWRAERTPVFVSLPENADASLKIQAAFEGKVAGFAKKPFAAADLQGRIEEALKASDVPNANREAAEEVALRAAVALQQPDPRRTFIDLPSAAESLVATLEARSDALRIEALKALGHAASAANGGSVRAHINKLTDIYGAQDAQLTPAVRAAFVTAIGRLDPTTEAALDILTRAVRHEDATVRAAAHAAVGHAIAITPAIAARFQLQQRLDVRTPGSGVAPAAPAAP